MTLMIQNREELKMWEVGGGRGRGLTQKKKKRHKSDKLRICVSNYYTTLLYPKKVTLAEFSDFFMAYMLL